MNWLTRFSLRNVAAVLILIILVTGGGVYTATQLKMEAMPDINFPVIVAVTPYPGASPEDIAEEVTKPIEREIMGVKGVDKVTSISADSTSVVVAQFDFDADLDKAQQQMRDALDRLDLPDDVMDTTFNRFGFNTFPMINFTVTSDKKNATELEQWVKDVVKPKLESIEGVGELQVKGEGPKAVYIRLNPEALKKHNLTLQQVQQALASAQMSLPLGDLNTGNVDMPVRIHQEITSVEDLKNFELTVPTNPTEGMQDAFNQIGQSMESLGQAVGGLGQAVGGLSEGLGQMSKGLGQVSQGLGQVSQGTQQLAKVQAHTQKVQAEMIGIQIELNKAMEQLQKDPENPELQQQIAMLQGQLKAKQAELVALSKQLQAMLAKMPKSSGAVPKGNGQSVKMPAAQGKTSAGTGKPEMKEPEIKTVKLQDIATITESAEGQSMITRTNGKPSINVEVIKNPDDNVVETADAVNAQLDQLAKTNKDVQFMELFDQSDSVKMSIHSMMREGLLGALFASVVILLFLRNVRMTLISIVSIPVSVFATLILLKQADVSLNIMTLGGMTVAIGRVVDDSIVVIENIYRHLMKGVERTSELIRLATKEVASAITSSTLTTVAVFVPLGMIEGIIGEVFYPFALTVTISLLCSLVVAVTIVPVLAKLLALNGKPLKRDRTRSRLAEQYKKALRWSLNHKKIVLVGSTLLLLGSFALVPLIGTIFLPSDKEKAMSIELKMPSGTNLEKTNQVAEQMEQKLKQHPEVKTISSSVGNMSGQMMANDGSAGSSNRASMFVTLADDTELDTFLENVRKELNAVDQNAVVNVSEVNSINPATNSIEVVITGDSMDKIRTLTNQLTAKIQKVNGLANVENNLSEQKKIVTIEVDDAKAAKKGLVAQQVAASVRGLLQADTIFEIEKGNESQEVKLGLEQDEVNSVDKVKEIRILSSAGELVPLKDIATVKVEEGPVTVKRENGQLAATISGDVTVKDTGAVSKDIQAQIDGTPIPKGVSVKLGGDIEQMNESFADLGKAMIVAVFSVYVVMLIAFGEATAPFTILFSLPYAVIGGLLGLWIAGQPISAPALIGALMLIGIVVTNAIVFVDRVQQMKKRGHNTVDALLEAGETRLRPILMTAFATIFALLPLALGYGEGAAMSQGLAIVVIGGLASSTFLTLFIVPIVYLFLSQLQERRQSKRSQQAEA
ncbi:efflux RND transporter permease subunit [Thermoactinomyces sp. CICC 23799]|uniref:efflux RND transporter permease subunit n=1 Tax=Thermoactinomyces sp. CICC 23799 TaxID=2767429 RepID=UPI0018DE7360|nr:efflux RND transporter permease subunit [Thermoactinomyces sp. CICC 23799]